MRSSDLISLLILRLITNMFIALGNNLVQWPYAMALCGGRV